MQNPKFNHFALIRGQMTQEPANVFALHEVLVEAGGLVIGQVDYRIVLNRREVQPRLCLRVTNPVGHPSPSNGVGERAERSFRILTLFGVMTADRFEQNPVRQIFGIVDAVTPDECGEGTEKLRVEFSRCVVIACSGCSQDVWEWGFLDADWRSLSRSFVAQ